MGVEPASKVERDCLDERDRFDYERVLDQFKVLAEIRFKLLAFLPTVSGTAVALLTTREVDRAEQVAIAVLGLTVTLAIFAYDQRNTQHYNRLAGRAEFLEGKRLKLLNPDSPDEPGGMMLERNVVPRHFLFLVPMKHDRALGIVYAVVAGAWAFALAEALVKPGDAAWIGFGVAALFVLEAERQDATFGKRVRDVSLPMLVRRVVDKKSRVRASGRSLFL
jgi:hypothetical protein